MKCLIFLLGKPEYELMQTAWRERNPDARIKAAKDAIALNPECATAYILLVRIGVRGYCKCVFAIMASLRQMPGDLPLLAPSKDLKE